jgi:NitT/TauT family transport system substrate-binding protein
MTQDARDDRLLGDGADLIKQRPDVGKGWLNAELDAQLFLSDPKNAAAVMCWVKASTAGMEDKDL